MTSCSALAVRCEATRIAGFFYPLLIAAPLLLSSVFYQPSYKIADGERISERGANWFTPSFGAGYTELDSVVEQLRKARCERRSAVGTKSRVAGRSGAQRSR
jgi:hypothetical protein